MASARRKRKRSRRAKVVPKKKRVKKTLWPMLKRYMTPDGLSIIVYKTAYAEGAEFGPTVRPRR